MDAEALIDMSVDECRTVTEYPATQEEYESLIADLISMSDGDYDTHSHTGAGHSGPESRGWTEVWSEDGWRVDVVHPPKR